MNLKIEQLRPDEWKRNKAIRLRALAENPSAFGTTLAEAQALTDESWRQRLARTDNATFVATTVHGGDVGLIVGAPYDDNAGLFSMWVAPEARQQGVGGRLVDAVIAWAKSTGFGKLILDVGDNNTAAIALYASRGFEPTGVRGTLPPPRDDVAEHQRALHLSD